MRRSGESVGRPGGGRCLVDEERGRKEWTVVGGAGARRENRTSELVSSLPNRPT